MELRITIKSGSEKATARLVLDAEQAADAERQGLTVVAQAGLERIASSLRTRVVSKRPLRAPEE